MTKRRVLAFTFEAPNGERTEGKATSIEIVGDGVLRIDHVDGTIGFVGARFWAGLRARWVKS